MTVSPAPLYPDHLERLAAHADAALRRVGRGHLLIASGVQKFHFLDDRPYPFQPNPHFKHWLPLTAHPHCWLAITPGERPRLVYYQPDDYWHLPPASPAGYWVDHFDIRIIREPEQARDHLPPAAASAIIGETDAALDGYHPDNPEALLAALHWQRGIKTAYELALMRQAQGRAVRGHRAAESAFRAGAAELDIHHAYLAASGHKDDDLPYGNIVALDAHGAVLHYQHQDAHAPTRSRSLLIDAGAEAAGYAADITRTHHHGDDDAFAALVAGVERVQLQLVEQVRAGHDYVALHLDAHRGLAAVLADLGLVRMDPEAMLDSGVSRVFFPHGIGHLIGLQVHDVAGFQRDQDGGRVAPPAAHPFLRLTRRLEPGMAVTIEPGLYFIDSLLAGLRAGPQAAAVDWSLVERLRPFGGVRIEDDVVCTAGAPENLTRDAFAAG